MSVNEAYKVYYGDGSVYSSTEYSWEEMPKEDVQAILVFLDEDYAGLPIRQIIHGYDDYRLNPEQERKAGKWMEDDDYEALLDRVLVDFERP